jgi:Spy/CpxP family protein refolding chaperone
MKLKLLAFCTGMFFAAATLAGQQPGPGSDPVGENLFPPELIMQNQKAIGLEEAQKTYIVSEISKAQGRFTELQWQLQEAMETLIGFLKRDIADEQQVLEQLDKVLNLEREVKRTQITLMVRIKNKLSSAQQAQLRKLRSRPQ